MISITFLSLCGCASHKKKSVPRIVSTTDLPDPLASLPDPSEQAKTSYTSPAPRLDRVNAPKAWYPPKSLERRWQAIVIHHSGTANGNMAIFDKWHREGNHWEGVGYDFVIGNGTDSLDGSVEVTFRWTQQMTGAHCKTPDNWANENAVGICLVGNFDESLPSKAQMKSLMKLLRFLCDRYRIPIDRVYGHSSMPGARVTDCPGLHFGLSSVRAMLSK